MVKKKSSKKVAKAKAETKTKAKTSTSIKAKATKAKATPKLLSGGNPQIPIGYGDAPVKAYIAAMPGWKSRMGKLIDALIVKTVPNVYKAVKWNSPFYGFEGDGWFISLHCYTKYIQVAFFQGASLNPMPPGSSKHKTVRYLNIQENSLDEDQFVDWIKQASKLPTELL